jgi:hypothetical protein
MKTLSEKPNQCKLEIYNTEGFYSSGEVWLTQNVNKKWRMRLLCASLFNVMLTILCSKMLHKIQIGANVYS